MSDGAGAAAGPPSGPTAGRLLREARERQGLHIAALAAAIKVTPRKLELLEADRFDELPDATFVRALAQTVCRALKIDPAAIMTLLPPPAGHRLEQVGEGLNARFRDGARGPGPNAATSLFASPAFWLTSVILLAALAVYFLPANLLGLASRGRAASEPASTPAAGDSTVAPIAAPIIAPVAAPVAPFQSASAAPAAEATPLAPASAIAAGDAAASEGVAAVPGAPSSGVIQLQASADSWIEVVDGRGKALLSRRVLPGEEVGLDGTPPFRLTVGNAAATRLVFRGKSVDLAASTRDNVARLELK